MRKFITGWLLLFVFWLLLSFTREPAHVVAGLVLSGLLSLLVAGKGPYREWLLNPVRLLWLVLYMPVFAYYCLKANLDVAYRVLHPDVPIRPGIIKVTTELKSKIAKTFLANSITLTLGTLTIDIVGQDLYIHCIYIETDDPDEQAAQITKRFEPFLKRIFE